MGSVWRPSGLVLKHLDHAPDFRRLISGFGTEVPKSKIVYKKSEGPSDMIKSGENKGRFKITLSYLKTRFWPGSVGFLPSGDGSVILGEPLHLFWGFKGQSSLTFR